MERVTVKDIRHMVIERNISRFVVGSCIRCQCNHIYLFADDGVTFQAECRTPCTTVSLSASSYLAVATRFNHLTSKERLRLWNKFVTSGHDTTDS